MLWRVDGIILIFVSFIVFFRVFILCITYMVVNMFN